MLLFQYPQPVFKHHCKACTYVGTTDCADRADVYIHRVGTRVELLFRHGNDLDDYTSYPVFRGATAKDSVHA